MTDHPISFLPHALERGAERFPGLTIETAEAEIREAFKAGRFSGQRPLWLIDAYRSDWSLYAWTEDGERTYGIRGGETCWNVKTIMARAF